MSVRRRGTIAQMARLGLMTTAVAALSISALGCDGCGTPGKDVIPKTAEKRVVQMAQRLPANTEAVLFVSDYEKTREALGSLKDRIGQALPIEDLERELKKEVGVDPLDPASYKKAGLAADAGLAVALNDNRLYFLTYVEDRQAFEKIIGEQLKKGLGQSNAVVKNAEADGVKVKYIGEDPGERVGWTYWGKMVLIGTSRQEGDNSEGALAKSLAQMSALATEKSVAETVAFKKFLATFKDWPISGFANPEPLMERARKEAQQDPAAAATVSWLEKNAEWMGFGLRKDDNHIQWKGYFAPGQEFLKKAQVVVKDIKKTEAGNFATENTLAGLRLSFDLDKAWELYQQSVPAEQKAELEEALRNASQSMGMDVEKDIIQALSGNVSIFLSGINILGLTMNSNNPEKIARAIQLIATLRFEDDKKLNALVDKVRQKSGGAIASEKKGDVLVLRPNTETPGVPDVMRGFVKGDTLTLATTGFDESTVIEYIEGKRRESKLAEAGEAKPLGKTFATRDAYSGLYLNIDRAADVAKGMPGVPEAASQVLREVNEAALTVDVDQTGVFASFDIILEEKTQGQPK